MTGSDVAIELGTLADQINDAHRQAEESMRAGLGHALNAGRLLIEAKAACPHGSWGTWLSTNVTCSSRSAQAYMRVARRWDELAANPQGPADLSLDEALRLLATPATPAVSAGMIDVDDETRAALDAVEDHMRAALRGAAVNALEIGRTLAKSADILDGRFDEWVQIELEMTPTIAAGLVRLAARYRAEDIASLPLPEVGAIVEKYLLNWRFPDV